MTLDEFKDALTEAGHQWRLIDDLTLSRGRRRYRIRDERGLCPICSLALDRGWAPLLERGTTTPTTPTRINSDWDLAAAFLGLETSDASAVLDVADSTPRRPYRRMDRGVFECLLTLMSKEERHDA